MSNNNQSSVQWLIDKIKNHIDAEDGSMSMNWLHDGTLEQAKAMQKQQAEHYATFIINCVNNNLPTITFNDWINSHNNEQ